MLLWDARAETCSSYVLDFSVNKAQAHAKSGVTSKPGLSLGYDELGFVEVIPRHAPSWRSRDYAYHRKGCRVLPSTVARICEMMVSKRIKAQLDDAVRTVKGSEGRRG
jgi:hypothetical protein